MIIQIDHIALASTNFTEHIEILKQLNYAPDFISENLINPRIKKDLMQNFSEYHDLALLKSPGNISIELLNHKYINSSGQYLFPVFGNMKSELIEASAETEILNLRCTKAILKSFDAEIFIFDDTSSGDVSFNKLILDVGNIEASLMFWREMGFNVVEDKGGSALLEFTSLITRDLCQLYLKGSDKPPAIPTRYLDDCGFSALALVSNSAVNERGRLTELGFKTTELERFKSTEKTLEIFFATGPSGELVEIISLES